MGVQRRDDGKYCILLTLWSWPSFLRRRGGEVGEPRNFFPRLAVGWGLRQESLVPASGDNRRRGCRLVRPAEGTGALASVRFNSVHSLACMDRHARHTHCPHHHNHHHTHTTSPPPSPLQPPPRPSSPPSSLLQHPLQPPPPPPLAPPPQPCRPSSHSSSLSCQLLRPRQLPPCQPPSSCQLPQPTPWQPPGCPLAAPPASPVVASPAAS